MQFGQLRIHLGQFGFDFLNPLGVFLSQRCKLMTKCDGIIHAGVDDVRGFVFDLRDGRSGCMTESWGDNRQTTNDQTADQAPSEDALSDAATHGQFLSIDQPT